MIEASHDGMIGRPRRVVDFERQRSTRYTYTSHTQSGIHEDQYPSESSCLRAIDP